MSIPIKQKRTFRVGKYDIIAEPMPYAMHMLRYNVYLDKKRIGGMVSLPSESDCLFLEKPPPVPPLKVFSVTGRAGRPKKTAAPAVALEREQPGYREPLPKDVSLDGMEKSDDR